MPHTRSFWFLICNSTKPESAPSRRPSSVSGGKEGILHYRVAETAGRDRQKRDGRYCDSGGAGLGGGWCCWVLNRDRNSNSTARYAPRVTHASAGRPRASADTRDRLPERACTTAATGWVSAVHCDAAATTNQWQANRSVSERHFRAVAFFDESASLCTYRVPRGPSRRARQASRRTQTRQPSRDEGCARGSAVRRSTNHRQDSKQTWGTGIANHHPLISRERV